MPLKKKPENSGGTEKSFHGESARGLVHCETAARFDKIDIVEVDDIFGYDKLVAAEKATLQKGMNYRVGKDYSVFLMSLRENAPYADALDEVTGMLIPSWRERSR